MDGRGRPRREQAVEGGDGVCWRLKTHHPHPVLPLEGEGTLRFSLTAHFKTLVLLPPQRRRQYSLDLRIGRSAPQPCFQSL